MPKNAQNNAYIYHFLRTCRSISSIQKFLEPESYIYWTNWIDSLDFIFENNSNVKVTWKIINDGQIILDTSQLRWYLTSITEKSRNVEIINDHVRKTALASGLSIHKDNSPEAYLEGRFSQHIREEELLSDNWAKSVDPSKIDVILMNESITAPEIRFITSYLGNLNNKKLLDIGCGLGEASVYFAIKGAEVTAVDLSRDMLKEVVALSECNNVHVNTHMASLMHLHIPPTDKYDVVYAGNVFHHVDIKVALKEVLSCMNEASTLICWEPVAYNPLINIYRKIAKHVRSDDEHPLTLTDIEIFKSYFSEVEVHWFWFTTLIIFILMFVWERRNPNKERFWKVVVTEGHKWEWIYKPLEKFDEWLLSTFPFLGPLCWNVVIIGKNPRYDH